MRVEQPGGRRKPSVHETLAAWQVLRASLAGDRGPVVARCAGCGQPMTADADLPAIPWTLPLPEGELVVDGDVRGPDGPVDPDRADALLKAAYGEPLRPLEALFQGSLLTLMAVPVLVWATAFFIVFWFLYNVIGGGLGL